MALFKKKDNVYTPEREEYRDGKLYIVLGAIAVVIIGIVFWWFSSGGDVQGGTQMVSVDKTGQTPGASLYTPREEAAIVEEVLANDGDITTMSKEEIAGLIDKTVNESVSIAFNYLGNGYNPNIKTVEMEKTLEQMNAEKDSWKSVFYSDYILYDFTGNFNITNPEAMTDEEMNAFKSQGRAKSNPDDDYQLVGDNATVIDDLTNLENGYITVSVNQQYQSGNSLVANIEYIMNISASGRIFDVDLINFATVSEGE